MIKYAFEMALIWNVTWHFMILSLCINIFILNLYKTFCMFSLGTVGDSLISGSP